LVQPQEAEGTIVGFAILWNTQGEARKRPQRFQNEASIQFHDPAWHQPWA